MLLHIKKVIIDFWFFNKSLFPASTKRLFAKKISFIFLEQIWNFYFIDRMTFKN